MPWKQLQAQYGLGRTELWEIHRDALRSRQQVLAPIGANLVETMALLMLANTGANTGTVDNG